MQITTKKLAEICGVSRGTIDRALNNRPGIDPDLRDMILDTARKLQYRPDYLAQSLVKGRTMTIGVIAFDLRNRFFAQLINAIEIKAKEQGYFVYLTLTEKDPQVEKSCIEHLVSRKVDALILCSVGYGIEYEQYLKNLNIPVLTVTNRIASDLPFIGIDDYSAMKDAARFVLEKGYQNIIYVSPALRHKGKVNLYAQEERLKGVVDALRDEGKEALVISDRNIAAVLDQIDFHERKKTAILCSNDLYALKILNYLRDRNLKVPEDVGLMGFDNIDTLEYVIPPLSTVAYPLDKIGQNAVEFLLTKLKGEENITPSLVEHFIIPGKSI